MFDMLLTSFAALSQDHSEIDLSESDCAGLSSAMVTALFHKPHDRQFIIDLENSIVSFIESNAESYELRPMNSYYRLLSHQIADYHHLKHALAKAPNNYVIIFKGDGFHRVSGKRLLQELEPDVGVLKSLHHLQDMKSSKKYKILRRREARDGSVSPPLEDSETSSTGTPSDFDGSKADLELQRVERERKYEQRKQEIFDTPQKEDVSLDKDDEGNSPQPSQFETSRYRFHNIDSTPPSQPRFNNRRRKPNHNGNKDKRFFNDSKFNHKDYHAAPGMPYGYMMYPAPSMGSGRAQPPLLPMLYPAPFPMDGNNGYIPQFMYQPMGNGMVNPEGPMPAGYMGFPPPFHYAQQPPNYQSMPPDLQNHNYSQSASEKVDSGFADAGSTDTQPETGKQKSQDKGTPLENGHSGIDEVTDGVGKMSV